MGTCRVLLFPCKHTDQTSSYLLKRPRLAEQGVYEECIARHHCAVSTSYARALIDIRKPLSLRQAIYRVRAHSLVASNRAVGVLLTYASPSLYVFCLHMIVP